MSDEMSQIKKYKECKYRNLLYKNYFKNYKNVNLYS